MEKRKFVFARLDYLKKKNPFPVIYREEEKGMFSGWILCRGDEKKSEVEDSSKWVLAGIDDVVATSPDFKDILNEKPYAVFVHTKNGYLKVPGKKKVEK